MTLGLLQMMVLILMFLLGAEYLVFVSSRSLKAREIFTNWDNLNYLSLYFFLKKSKLSDETIEDGRSMTTFYHCSINHQS